MFELNCFLLFLVSLFNIRHEIPSIAVDINSEFVLGRFVVSESIAAASASNHLLPLGDIKELQIPPKTGEIQPNGFRVCVVANGLSIHIAAEALQELQLQET